MKFMIQTRFKDGPEPPNETAAKVLADSISHLKSLQGKVEALYGYGSGDAMAIVDAASAEEAWKVALSSPMSRYLQIEVHALTDLVVIQEHLLSALKA